MKYPFVMCLSAAGSLSVWMGSQISAPGAVDEKPIMMQDQKRSEPALPLSILVVDDDELNRRMMELLLKRDGHAVVFASNGEEALEAVKAERFDIVLMDLQMPVMDGVEASRRIRSWEADRRHTYIVALTASYMPERGRELYEAGIDNYLAKPFELSHLRNILLSGEEGYQRATSPKIKAIAPETKAEEPGIDFQVGVLRVGGNREVYYDLLNDFIAELPEKMKKLQDFFKTRDWESLYRAAHNLKGVSANLGALQLSEHAGRLEKQVQDGYNETVEGLLNEVLNAARKLMKTALDPAAGN
jgi:two-component system sensor histidine kinase/response regulator